MRLEVQIPTLIVFFLVNLYIVKSIKKVSDDAQRLFG